MQLQILTSYAYFAKYDLGEEVRALDVPYARLFADSGAFTAHNKGEDVKLADYVAWIRRNERAITAYCNLDVIGDGDASYANQLRMEDAGLSPIPVYHAFTPYAHLDRYLERGYKYVALGGMAGKQKPPRAWLVECFKRCAQAGAVIHGFGVGSARALAMLPWYSTDASNWRAAMRFCQVALFDDERGRFQTLALGSNPRALYTHRDVIREAGADPDVLAAFKRGDVITQEMHTKLAAIMMVGFARMERWLRRRHGVIPGPTGPGVQLYLVASGYSPFKQLCIAYRDTPSLASQKYAHASSPYTGAAHATASP